MIDDGLVDESPTIKRKLMTAERADKQVGKIKKNINMLKLHTYFSVSIHPILGSDLLKYEIQRLSVLCPVLFT